MFLLRSGQNSHHSLAGHLELAALSNCQRRPALLREFIAKGFNVNDLQFSNSFLKYCFIDPQSEVELGEEDWARNTLEVLVEHDNLPVEIGTNEYKDENRPEVSTSKTVHLKRGGKPLITLKIKREQEHIINKPLEVKRRFLL